MKKEPKTVGERIRFLRGGMNQMDFANKKVALFGTGDQQGYPDTYCDAVGILVGGAWHAHTPRNRFL